MWCCDKQSGLVVMGYILLGIGLASLTVFGQGGAESAWQRPADRWLEHVAGPGEPHVPTMIERAATIPPDTGVLLMAGAHTASAWSMQKWFSDFRTANVAFGGSYVTDSTHFVDELVVPYQPSTIVMDMGRPDLEAGKSPAQTVTDIQSFIATVRRALPTTQVVVLSLRPSPAHLDIWSQIQETNDQLRAWASRADQPDVHYVDIVTVTLGTDGDPRPEFFVQDAGDASIADARPTELAFLEWSLVVKPVVYAVQDRYRMLNACDRWGCGAQR